MSDLNDLVVKLKSGEYDGNDVMQAWIAIEELQKIRDHGAEPAGWVSERLLEDMLAGKLCGIGLNDEPCANYSLPLYTRTQPAQQGSVPEEAVSLARKWLGMTEGGFLHNDDITKMAEALVAAPQPEGYAVAVPVSALEYLKDQWPGAYAKLYERVCSNKRPQPPREDE